MLAVILLALLAVSSAEDRIHNGTEAKPDLASVVFIYSRRQSQDSTCTGTVISEHYVLTAAHCVPPSTKSVEIYTRDIHLNEKWKTHAPSFQADQWILHRDYKNFLTGYDIALIRVATPMTIPPVPLPANYSHPKDDWFRAAGYGATNYTIINATHFDPTARATSLMETYLHGAVGKDCFKASYLEEYPHLMNVICVGKSDSTILQGDSGGPSFAQGKDGRFYQVGITSFNGLMSDVYKYISWSLASKQRFTFISAVTDVSYYCPWIEETTGGQVKCQTFDAIKIVPKF
uniref:Peptidase S1 domain-containing protein n=1 Tax=Panagrolaimus sp. JU765 TaxID=591449 RepID=A0AC34RKB6_9BILA